MFFEEVSQIINEKAITLVICQKGGIMSVSAIVSGDQELPPIVCTGTPKEQDAGFLAALKTGAEEIIAFTSNIKQYQEAIKDKIQEVKTKPAGNLKDSKNKSSQPAAVQNEKQLKKEPAEDVIDLFSATEATTTTEENQNSEIKPEENEKPVEIKEHEPIQSMSEEQECEDDEESNYESTEAGEDENVFSDDEAYNWDE